MKIVVDGLIGAGKSTQVELIHKRLGIPIVKEPIEEWPLDLFYSDPVRWGFTMQVAVLNSFVKLRNVDGIFERCPESSRAVFWRNLVESGSVNETENKIFQKLYNTLSWEPDVIILIDKNPELCYDHIQYRNQAGDSKITLDYLKRLHSYYEDFKKSNVVIIDGNRSIEDISEDIISVITRLRDGQKM